MKTVFLDFETYYDDEYSLRKMTPVEYILDPRFEVIGCAVKYEIDGQSFWVDGPDLPAFFAGLDASVTILVSHNALFDMCIVSWIYRFIPRLMIDTLGVARAVLGHVLRSLSLDSVARHLGLGVKGGALAKVKGMRREAILSAGLMPSLIDYALNDADLCAGIYDKLVRQGAFPMPELIVMDMVIRATTEPQFVLDQTKLAEHLHQVQTEKEHLLTKAMLVSGAGGKADLMSNDRFAEMLRSLGVEPPTKVSPVTGRTAFAFAKTDPDFLELQEHDNPAVQVLVAARLGHKSTIEETRTQRFLNIARLTWPGYEQGLMPMPLRFSGAHTHRLSGDWSLNVQNMGRGSALRYSLMAATGFTVVTVDSSQIEARIVAWLCQVWELVNQFANGDDVYALFAELVFGRPINKKDDPVERFIGKTGVLGLGFGVSWMKFQKAVKTQSVTQMGRLVELTDAEAVNIVNTYRTRYHGVPNAWRTLNSTGIQTLAYGGTWQFGPVTFSKGEVLLPNGLKLFYHDLKKDDEGNWSFTYGGKPKRIYGAALLENIVQALARIIVMDAAVRIRTRMMRFALQVHDELVYIVPNEFVSEAEQILLEEMNRRPEWAPELPLAAEAGHGSTYGNAK